MSCCSDPSGYRGVFDEKVAERTVRDFEKNGLDSTATSMVETLSTRGIDGATVLEVGAGSGTALVSMIESGADHAIGVDLSPSYEQAARALFAARGHADKIEWHVGDFVDMNGLPPADIVFLNRVVCCYPFMPEMIGAATERTKHYLAVAYPRRRWLSRLGSTAINVWMRIRRNSFRTFIHDPAAIVAAVESAGMQPVAAGATAVWHWEVWERPLSEAQAA